MIWTIIELTVLASLVWAAEKPKAISLIKQGWDVFKAGLNSLMGHFLPETRTSNPVSKLLRPVFEHSHLKTVVGLNLAGLMLVAGSSAIPGAALGITPRELETDLWADVQVETKKAVVQPVPDARGISQGYHIFHQAVDIKAYVGSEVRPIAAGTVEEVVYSIYGYGFWVLVDHGNETKSLYAHLGEISVEVNQEVKTDTTIGSIGLTGKTTGPHLHLEIFENGRNVNPLVFLSGR